MLAVLLGWLPVIGPIISGVTSLISKYFDTKAAMYATERTADVEESKISAQIIQITNDDIALRVMRDLVCLPVVIWSMFVGWDTIVANHWHWLMWHTANYPVSVGYLPYAVLVFLLGNIGLNMWNRK